MSTGLPAPGNGAKWQLVPMVYRRYTRRMATTIKVPEDLRDRLNARARASDLTVAQVIEHLIAADDRAERFRAIKAARARMTPAQWAEYDAETQMWERASNEDLETYDPSPDEPAAR